MALLRKQNQILSGNKNLDSDEDIQRMSEPNLYTLIAVLLSFLMYRQKNKIKTLISEKSPNAGL